MTARPASEMDVVRFLIDDLPWPADMELVGKDLMWKLDHDRRLVMKPSSFSHSEHWSGFGVQVVSKTLGELHRTTVKFDDVFDGRSDSRTDYPLGGNRTFEVLQYCGAQWYIAVPDDESRRVWGVMVEDLLAVWR